jgi:hypothetical protein
MLKYFRTIACLAELVLGTNYVKPINELILTKITDIISVSVNTFSRGQITAHLLLKYLLSIFHTLFKTRFLC